MSISLIEKRNLCRCRSGLRQRHAGLPLVLAAAIAVRGFADLVGLQEQHLRDAFVGVDLRRQGRGVGDSSVTCPSHSGSSGVTLTMMPQRA